MTAIRPGPEMRVRLDEWARENGFNSRSEAIRRLVEQGLNAGNTPDEPNPVAAGKAGAQAVITALGSVRYANSGRASIAFEALLSRNPISLSAKRAQAQKVNPCAPASRCDRRFHRRRQSCRILLARLGQPRGHPFISFCRASERIPHARI
jgi:hypothetical protein